MTEFQAQQQAQKRNLGQAFLSALGALVITECGCPRGAPRPSCPGDMSICKFPTSDIDRSATQNAV